ncbi:MAG: VOC family protein [Longispora sp.]|nr:VOC family protein [Longispora sp. (in: high G+C Gram-positive bacteria)]
MTKNYAQGTPCWIDLGSTDVNEASRFYTTLFGWTVDDLGPESGGYRIFRQAGKQVAGLGPATDPDRGTSWATYFATSDADKTAMKVAEHGGKVIVEPMDVMDQGRMAVFSDPSGAFFSVWEPRVHKGMEFIGGHGGLVWSELYTTDIDTAKAFYTTVFSISTRDIHDDERQIEMAYSLLEVNGQSVAGMMKSPNNTPSWGVYFAVDDLDTAADKAIELGAKELFRQDSPPGRMAGLVDPQGGIFSLIKPNPDFVA